MCLGQLQRPSRHPWKHIKPLLLTDAIGNINELCSRGIREHGFIGCNQGVLQPFNGLKLNEWEAL